MDRALPTDPLPALPPQPISLDVLREKYLKPGEQSVDDLFDRVARAVADAEAPEQRALWAARFRQHLAAGACRVPADW
ncbi:ribonucleotide reductase N-terminal alpha domain-containing protein [Tepidimonas charontis]|uniref:Ribonucleotide reductase large subunit N-terminal domain-containing protein n=1 Tax=Tepidimonas charontis TaxID=2267262 RepID=A0A554XBG4_9BURK|nr:hypothetical protein Tchar_01866 [Tepidimonas charontis]